MPQTHLWKDPTRPQLDELPLHTRRRILQILARMLRRRVAQWRKGTRPLSKGRKGGGHD